MDRPKLWRFYAGWPAPEPLLEELVREWKSLKGEIRPFLMAMWTNPNFYDPVRAADRVKSPTEWLVGLCRQLGRPLPAPVLSSHALSLLGQNLFEPPNVKGWDGGIVWINTSSISRRYEYGSWLVDGTQGLQKLSTLNMAKMAGESGLLKMSLPEISPAGVVIPHGIKDMDPVEKQAATEKMREALSLPPLLSLASRLRKRGKARKSFSLRCRPVFFPAKRSPRICAPVSSRQQETKFPSLMQRFGK